MLIRLILLVLCAWPALASAQQELRSSTKGASTPLPITGSVIDADHNALDVKCLSGCSGGGGSGDASLAEQQTQTGILTTIDGDTGNIATSAALIDDAIATTAAAITTKGMAAAGTDGTNARILKTDTSGELQIDVLTLPTLPAGTNAIGKLSANSGVDIGDVDVTSVVPGTAAASLGKAEDAAHTTGDTGVMSLCVRRDTAATSATTDGDYNPCATDASGRLWSNTELPDAAALADDTANPTVPGVGSFNMCWDGSTWDRCTKATAGNGAVDTATQRVTIANDSTGNLATIGTSVTPGTSAAHLGKAEDGAHTTGDTGVMLLGVRAASPTDRSAGPTDGDYEPLGINAAGAVWTTPTPTTAGGLTTHYLTSAASTNSTNVKNAAGQVYLIRAVNTTSTLYFLRMYNASAAPTCSSATNFIETIPIPASASGAGIVIPQYMGQTYATGISYCLTGGGSSTDNTNAATGVYLTILYK